MLKIIYYLFFSIIAVGIYHWMYESIQESFSYYFSFSKVKKTDKLFDLVEESIQKEKEKEREMGVLEKVENSFIKREGIKGEEEKDEIEVEKEGEDLFRFIDGL